MESIFSNQISTPNSPALQVQIEVELRPTATFELDLSLIINGQTYLIQYAMDASEDQFIVKNLNQFATNVSCLALCGIALGGIVYDCYKKNKKNWGGFLKCIKEQNGTIAGGLAACLYPCF
jgi:hypothetical protein